MEQEQQRHHLCRFLQPNVRQSPLVPRLGEILLCFPPARPHQRIRSRKDTRIRVMAFQRRLVPVNRLSRQPRRHLTLIRWPR